MSDDRQRLLDALAEVERLAAEATQGPWELVSTSDTISIKHGRRAVARVQKKLGDRQDAALIVALHALLPTLSALREVVEMHGSSEGGDTCSECGPNMMYPCNVLSDLTRQFEEE